MEKRLPGSQRTVASAEAAEITENESPTSQPVVLPIPRARGQSSIEENIAEPAAPSLSKLEEAEISNTRARDFQNIDEDIYDASPPRKSADRARKDEVDYQDAAHPNSPEKILESINRPDVAPKKKRNSVKLKAKEPIRVSQGPHSARDSAKESMVVSPKQDMQPSKTTAKKNQPDAKLSDVARVDTSKAKEADEFDSGALTSPDPNDASTPRVAKSANKDDEDYIPPKLVAQTATNESQAKNQRSKATNLNGLQAKNRSVGLSSRPKPIVSNSAKARDVFELPNDDEDVEKPLSVKKKGKNLEKVTSRSSQGKKPAPETKEKADAKKRKSAPPAIEAMPPPKAKPAKKRESAPPIVESMPPPKPMPNSKKRQSAPPTVETMLPPQQRITRSNKNALSLAGDSESQSQEMKAKSTSKTSTAQHKPVPHNTKGEEDAPVLVDDDSFDIGPISEKDIVKNTPVKANGKPNLTQKTAISPSARKSSKNPLINMASKLDSMLDLMNAHDEDANDSTNDSPAKNIPHSKNQSGEHDEQKEVDEVAGLSGVESPKVNSTTSRVPDKPERSIRVQNSASASAIKDKSTESLEVSPLPRDSTSPAERSKGTNESRKRKTATKETTPSKRPRPNDKETEALASPSSRRSPRIASKMQQKSNTPLSKVSSQIPTLAADENQLEESSMGPPNQVNSHDHNERKQVPEVTPVARIRPSQKLNKKSPRPTRRSPRTKEGPEEIPAAAAALTTTNSKTPLVDDRLSRKPGVISFNRFGALNQGISSTPRLLMESQIPKSLPSKETSGQKRKHDATEFTLAQSPPKKRQSISPPEANVVEEYEEGNQPDFGSSPPQPLPNPARLAITHQPLQLRPSSQGSRVDPNGSPRASPINQIDHIGRIHNKLKEQGQHIEEQIEEDAVQARPRRISDVFGPRVRLSSQVKEAPITLDKSQPRYVAHKKTKNGHYEKVDSQEIILPQKVLPDPFVEKTRRSSGFTERLQTEGSAPRKSQINQQKGVARQSLVDPEKTLVNAGSRPRVEQCVPSLSSGTSVDSHSSEPSRSPLKEMNPAEMWNVAVRPHYSTLRQAVHRIADEVIIRLADEEDKMDLMVGEYKENGAKILDNIAQKRAEEKSKMLESLEERKNTMISAYSATRKSISSTMAKLKQQPIGSLEKDWRNEQDFIREKMGQGSAEAE